MCIRDSTHTHTHIPILSLSVFHSECNSAFVTYIHYPLVIHYTELYRKSPLKMLKNQTPLMIHFLRPCHTHTQFTKQNKNKKLTLSSRFILPDYHGYKKMFTKIRRPITRRGYDTKSGYLQGRNSPKRNVAVMFSLQKRHWTKVPRPPIPTHPNSCTHQSCTSSTVKYYY